MFFDIGIKINLKKIFYKKEKKDNVTTVKILGVTFKYVKGSIYKNYVDLLQYIQPHLKEDISDFISYLNKKSKLKYISAKEHVADIEKHRAILNKLDPAILPKAKGDFGTEQNHVINFVKEILYDIYQNTELKPFMDYGTLLGAVRHKGFIPWDADVDFTLMREDYIKLTEYLSKKYIYIDTSKYTVREIKDERQIVKDALKKYPNEIFCIKLSKAFKVFRKYNDGYLAVDFFALDYYNDKLDVLSLTKYIENVKGKYTNAKLKTLNEWFSFWEKEIRESENIVDKSNVIHAGIDSYGCYFYSLKTLRRFDDIFPLKKVQFEDGEFYAPNNPHEYLKAIYSDYSRLPNRITVYTHQYKKFKLNEIY